MNWEAIGAIGEILGAIGVIASLLYLSLQIRHNSRQIEAQVKGLQANSLNAIENTFTRFRESIIRDPQVASVWERALDLFDELEMEEKVQASTMFSELCFAWQNNYTRALRGEYDLSEIEHFVKNLVVVLSRPGARKWWEESKVQYSPDFVPLIDARLRDSA
jgi:hypothetical protein